MMHRAAGTVLFAASLAGLAACSRMSDGTVVPTYRMAVGDYAGIPILTLKATPLDAEVTPPLRDEAVPADTFPPVPPAPPALPQAVAAKAASAPAAQRSRQGAARRRSAERPAPPAAEPLQCRSRQSGERAVSILCE